MLLTSSQLTALDFTVVEPSVRSTTAYLQQLAAITKLFEQAQLRNSNLTARSYQLDAAAIYCTRYKNVAALSQGLGKTLISTLVAANLYSQTKRYGTIHICIPNLTMLPRWLEDLKLVFAESDIYCLSAKDFGGTALARKNNLIRGAKILIYTHDLLRAKAKGGHCYGHYLQRSARPSLLIIDEIHHFKDPHSLKYLALEPIARSAKRVLGLSGTLSEGSLASVAAILQLVYQRDWIYFRQEGQLANIYGSDVNLGLDYRSGEETASKNAKQLQTLQTDKLPEYFSLVRRYIHRLSIDDPQISNQINLPVSNFQSVELELNEEQNVAYQAEIDTSRSALITLASSSLSSAASIKTQSLLMNAIRICNCGVDEQTPIPKSELTLDLVSKATKTVIFCQYVSSARFIYRQLASVWGQDRLIRVYAKDPEFTPIIQTPQQRWAAISKFESDPTIVAGVFSLNLAAEAIDLVAADRVIIYCSPWSSAKFDQCLRRTLRPGNRHPQVDVYIIYHSRAIDSYQLQLISAKQQIGRLLLDYTFEQSSELDIDRELIKRSVLSL